ncbi:hypothetical protein [Peribacillus deserti]|uniref:Tyr recombinase domain-containing protein n=1 Tax=Peribacillus deserti TaxID=673318 RepID=A0A2N5M822_9BACI|nr:hypothetical protein [Peribacillus deserti]PLT30511.1 hypothetical protein CUU66_07580 [Peribacillus deserti]
MELSNYKFVARETEFNEIVQGKMRNIKAVTIGVLEKTTGIIYPHPVTDFIKSQYGDTGGTINSQSAPASLICRFLNFCIQKIDDGDAEFHDLNHIGLSALERKHASKFITTKTFEGLQPSSINQYDTYLTQFYIYLKKANLIDEEFPIEGKKNSKGEIIHKSIFKGVPKLNTKYPSRDTTRERPMKLKDFGEERAALTARLIQVAMDKAPEIALGICFQFYGGLRRGEVVNLDRSSLIVTRGESMEVQIKDNRRRFFSRLSDTKRENPKRLNYLKLHMARQTILDNDLVWDIYDKHIKKLNSLLKKDKIKKPSALFVDENGYPMSGLVYDKRFNKVKEAFLKSLIGHKDYEQIESTFWLSHAGRGIFTNMLIDLGFSVTQLAIARGDTNINSAMAYIDEVLSNEQMKEAINELKKYPIQDLGVIDYKHVQKWKKLNPALKRRS